MNHIQDLLNSRLTTEEQLAPFLIPVEQRTVGYEYFTDRLFPNERLKGTEDYISIVQPANNQLISIMPKSYKLVTNEEVIIPVLEFLSKYDNRWLIDSSHSFVDSRRMRLQITFPDLTINDGESDVALSLFLHNSYNGVEGVRGFWGAIRAICSNGMVFGKLIGSFYHRHTSGIDLVKLQEQLEQTSSKIPVIEERIKILQAIESNSLQLETVERTMGKRAKEYIDENFKLDQSQYILLNVLTHYVSHYIQQNRRAQYQRQISNLFNI